MTWIGRRNWEVGWSHSPPTTKRSPVSFEGSGQRAGERQKGSLLGLSSSYQLPWWLSGQESSCNAGDARDRGSIPGWGRSPGGGHGSPLQNSCLENPMDWGAWSTAVHGVTKGQTQLKWLSTAQWCWLNVRVYLVSVTLWIAQNKEENSSSIGKLSS